MHEDKNAFIATLWPNSYWSNTSLTPYPYDATQANSCWMRPVTRWAPMASAPVPAMASRSSSRSASRPRLPSSASTNVLHIQSDLKKIGIDIKPNHIPAGTFFGSYTEGADMTTGKFDMAIFTTGYYPDPDATSSWDCLDVPNKDNPSGANDYHLCDPKLDAMFAQGLATADPAARKTVYDQIQQYMYDNVLMIPLYARANVYGYAARFVFPPSSGYSNAFWDAENFDVTK